MNPYEAPLALLAFLGLVAATPIWAYYVTSHPAVASLQLPTQLLVGLTLPATAIFLLVSWVQPGG